MRSRDGRSRPLLAAVLLLAAFAVRADAREPERRPPPEPAPDLAGEAPSSNAGALAPDSVLAQLPSGHPPLAPPPGPLPDLPPGSGTGASALRWATPEAWIEETPTSQMRRAQYRIEGAAGADAECVVYYFGPGQGGDPMANVQRWADQFSQPDGRPSRDVLEVETREIGAIQVLLAKITGTYSGGMSMRGGPPQSLEGYMLLGAVAAGPDANWFFKLTGPEATVRGAATAFREMIESIEPGA